VSEYGSHPSVLTFISKDTVLIFYATAVLRYRQLGV